MADFEKTISGWNPWKRVATQIKGSEKLDAPFPTLYTPASAFWVLAPITNCSLFWLVPINPLTAFFLGGGSSFTLVGAMAGVALADVINTVPPIGSFGWNLRYRGPEMGFCIDSLFKQHLYVKFTILNQIGEGTIAVPDSHIELLQNYRTKRIYVDHGSVTRYVKVGDQHILTLDIERGNAPKRLNVKGERITIYNAVDKITTDPPKITIVDILEVKSNWDLVISDPGEGNQINSGDFYILSNTWCIEDPYLLSGFWQGTESDNGDFTSGSNLFVTSHVKPFVSGTFTGVYIYKNLKNLKSGDGEVVGYTPGAPFRAERDEGGITDWTFFGIDGGKSVKYSDNSRYQEYLKDDESLFFDDFDYDRLADASQSDYDYIIDTEDIGSIRVELSVCGDTTRQNFYNNALTGQYIWVFGKYFKILAQVTADVIDVNKISVDGSTIFNPMVDTEYSILNHKGWFITEHYDGYSLELSRGVFKGPIFDGTYNGSTEETTLILDVQEDSSISWRESRRSFDYLPQNNFIQRYRTTCPIENPKRMYEKYDGWRLVVPSAKAEYEITEISFAKSPSSFAESLSGYSIEMKVNGDLSRFFLYHEEAYISFGETFQTYGNFSKENGYNLQIEYANTSNGQLPPFMVSNMVCMDGQYISNPYLLDIPLNARVSVCGGYLFGLDANANSNRDLFLFITTPTGGRGIASLFHTLRQEGWIAYVDPNTNRMTIRRGSLDYKEYPIKSEIVIGYAESVGAIKMDSGSNVVNLDHTKERLRRLSFSISSRSLSGDIREAAMMFGIGSPSNIHGFVVSGDGIVNLQAAHNPDSPRLDSSTWTTTEGQKVSPVYQYDYVTKAEVDIAVDIKGGDNKVYISYSGDISDVSAQYITESQTLEDPGFFDILRLRDGEILLIYGQKISDFKIGKKEIKTERWVTPKGVMVVGTSNDDFNWGLVSGYYEISLGMSDEPITPSSGHTREKALMLMNNVEYYSSIYNPLNDTIMIFVRALNEGTAYIGAYTIPIRGWMNKSLYEGHYINKDLPTFLYRPPTMEASFLDDFSASWLEADCKITAPWPSPPLGTNKPLDTYVRVLGPESVGCQVVSGQELSTISTCIAPDGTYVLIYDSSFGIKMAFSNNNGRTWTGCDVVVSREGRSGILVSNYLIYITSEGIEIKYTNWSDIYQLRGLSQQKQAGKVTINLEKDIQNRYDHMSQGLIGSGIISFQRLSGYVTPEGIIKVFYYGDSNEMICMETSNARSWKIADNF